MSFPSSFPTSVYVLIALICCAVFFAHANAQRQTHFVSFGFNPNLNRNMPSTVLASTEPRYAAERVHISDPATLITSSDWSTDVHQEDDEHEDDVDFTMGAEEEDSEDDAPGSFSSSSQSFFVASNGEVFAASMTTDPNGEVEVRSTRPVTVTRTTSPDGTTVTTTTSTSSSSSSSSSTSFSSSTTSSTFTASADTTTQPSAADLLTNAFLSRFGAEDLEQPEDEPLPEFRVWLHPKRHRDGPEFRNQLAPLVAHLTELGLRRPRRFFNN